jgi:HK97 family phage major capsid protein
MEPKDIITEIRSDFEQFKTENDKRLTEIAKSGQATAETTARVDKLNAAIEANQGVLTTRLDDMETRLNRPFAGGAGGSAREDDRTMHVYAAWQSIAQGRVVDADQVDMGLVQNYNRAFRDWMRHGDRAASDSLRVLNEMSVASAPDGGYLVSPDATGSIATMIYETSPIRRLASVQTISSDVLEGTNDLDEAGAGWVGETAVRAGNTTTPDVGVWRIPAHEQYAEPNVTQKVLDDASINVEAWLAGKVATRFARNENTAFVTGDGLLKPRGFTTYANGTPTAAAWNVIQQVVSGAAGALTADGLINLVTALKSGYMQGAVFGMQRLTQAAIRKLKDGNGNYLWQPDFQTLGAPALLNFPLIEMPDMAAVGGGALPIVFGNFRAAYQIVDRLGVRVLRDPYTRKGWVKFYTTKRVGGDVINFEALKLQVVSA